MTGRGVSTRVNCYNLLPEQNIDGAGVQKSVVRALQIQAATVPAVINRNKRDAVEN